MKNAGWFGAEINPKILELPPPLRCCVPSEAKIGKWHLAQPLDESVFGVNTVLNDLRVPITIQANPRDMTLNIVNTLIAPFRALFSHYFGGVPRNGSLSGDGEPAILRTIPICPTWIRESAIAPFRRIQNG